MENWEVCNVFEGYEIGYRAIIDSEGNTVCNPSPMGEQRARLIAAAPHLLAALHAALDVADQDKSEGFPVPDWYWQARAAVARASI
jgi:hypothetical protein